MNKCVIAVALVAALTLGGCNRGPRIDASTPETLKTSTEAVRAAVAPELQQEFDRAVMVIIATTLDPAEIIESAQSQTLTKASIFAKMAPVLDDKSHADLMDMARKDKKLLASKLAEWDSARQVLSTRQAAYQSITLNLAGVSAVNATLEAAPNQMVAFVDQATTPVVVRMRLQNGTDYPIQRIKVMVELGPQGAQMAWAQQLVEKTFDSPIEPGGFIDMDSPVINVTVPAKYTGSMEMEAQVEVTQLEAKGGSPLITLPTWTSADELELVKLEIASSELKKLGLL